MSSIMAAPPPMAVDDAALETVPPDVAPLMWALERMRPELLAPGVLPGETLAEARCRRAVGLDVLDDLLAEYEAGVEGVAA